MSVLVCSLTVASASDSTKLPKKYSEWLKRDVGYIITKEEDQAFEGLNTRTRLATSLLSIFGSAQPKSGAPTNSSRRSIPGGNMPATTSQFGVGWNTDMGHIYITLGPPPAEGALRCAERSARDGDGFIPAATQPCPPFFYIVLGKGHRVTPALQPLHGWSE